MKSILSEVHKLIRLYLTIPITSASSSPERSFSALKHVITYSRSSMTKQRLNSNLVLYIHKKLTDECDLTDIARQYFCVCDERRKHFGIFLFAHDFLIILVVLCVCSYVMVVIYALF